MVPEPPVTPGATVVPDRPESPGTVGVDVLLELLELVEVVLPGADVAHCARVAVGRVIFSAPLTGSIA
jgi:hypothetical protein